MRSSCSENESSSSRQALIVAVYALKIVRLSLNAGAAWMGKKMTTCSPCDYFEQSRYAALPVRCSIRTSSFIPR